ncbi:uncharacterized protein J8A68_004870 [[Candida] subhashii]|uniref:Rab-GAP TBC domain-containing protein n=1 Tax=[Candida] subhashii TaxID=561895 RepID=A0A8J5QEI2_9ASCO|nr:uncharacterized protein J8A68_004870 [[Candida] subhashii]KAG7661602.1 hypothetical protein J8A68_004870 [[Candida] subhashii]
MLKENDIISKVLLTIDKVKGSLTTFKTSVTEGDYTSLNCPNSFTRTLIWKACLITDSLKIQTWDSRLSDSRVVYHQLVKRDDMKLPWWDLDKDHMFYETEEITRKTSIKRTRSLRNPKPVKKSALIRVTNIEDDPLSSRSPSHSPNTKYIHTDDDLELFQAIILDIDRLFPGEEFFHSNNPKSIMLKRQMVEILYVWSKCNPQVGYKQGIHEILGLIFMALYKESVEIPLTNTFSSDDLRILSLYDINYLSHDLFTILNKFLVQSGVISQFYENESVLWKSIEAFNVKLMKVDQFINYNLGTKLKIESQLWIIRYLRLMLLRELGNDLETTSLFWDKLIASQLTNHSGNCITAIPDLICFSIIQMLIQIKTDLISCDFSESLSLLLHYPIASKFSSPTHRNAFVTTLYKEAVKLYELRDKDLKLYEYGIKLNNKYNPNLKISMSYTGSARSSADSNNSSRRPSLSRGSSEANSIDSRAEKMKFEKLRLEMRLKKKAQQIINQ